jgi:hypothetical protein
VPNIFDELSLADKVFLEAEYSTILSELREGKGRGQIVRRMKCEGYDVQEALELYNKLSGNTMALEKVVQQLQREIREFLSKQREYENSLRSVANAEHSQELALRRKEEEKFREEMGHLAIHSLGHILHKLFGG